MIPVEPLILYLLIAVRLLPVSVLLGGTLASTVPRRWALGIALVLAAVVAPAQGASAVASSRASTVLAGALLREALVGLALAAGFAILLGGLQLAGAWLSQLTGLSLPDVPNESDAVFGSTAVQRYHTLLALSVFWVSGGHRLLVEALLDSFAAIPVAGLPANLDAASLLSELLAHSMRLGVRAAAPLAFCLIAASGLLAILARSMPFFGAFGVGLTVNFVLVLLVSCASLQTLASLYQHQWSAGVQLLVRALHPHGG
jgi:flagellar biosynthetic protein FliR